MPVTVGGTSITFNDGTSQSTDAVGTVRSAADTIICTYMGGFLTGSTSVSSFSLGFTGSARFKLHVAGTSDGKSNFVGYIYLDKNGVRQGTWSKGGPGMANVANINLSAKPGDIFTIGHYMNSYGPGWGGAYCNLGMA
jgi:hypothetical protein